MPDLTAIWMKNLHFKLKIIEVTIDLILQQHRITFAF